MNYLRKNLDDNKVVLYYQVPCFIRLYVRLITNIILSGTVKWNINCTISNSNVKKKNFSCRKYYNFNNYN